jgi:plastocyanin
VRIWRPYFFLLASFPLAVALGQDPSAVSGQVRLVREGRPLSSGDTGVVVWLEPTVGATATRTGDSERPREEIVQRGKRFETRLLAVEVGTVVDFPNLDPFFHNVFSLFDGTRFDLGLYEAGSTKSVPFERAGVCYIFCNIHSEMSATVVVLDTPWFTVLDAPGEFRIPDVPEGRYRIQTWSARSMPETLEAVSRLVTVGAGLTLVDAIDVEADRDVVAVHTNKYGREYDPPVFSSPIYSLP